ncbi:cytochrome b5 domain-containing protein [Candidatus Parcubacteria bacterium]|nr:cytochrome b5 domain-containing protein [Candidatus Parcubacteria bacterium]
MNKILIGLVAVAVLGGVGYWYFSSTNSSSFVGKDGQPIGTTSVDTSKTYTLADVATHAAKESCWSAIDGGVYDLTAWISQHPGGERNILKICGKDGSAAFNGQHGSQAQPNDVLAAFKIGTLVQ